MDISLDYLKTTKLATMMSFSRDSHSSRYIPFMHWLSILTQLA